MAAVSRTPLEVTTGFLGRMLWALVTLSVPGVIVGYFATSWWVFETYAGFRIQFALILGLGILLAFRQNRRYVAGVLLLASIVNGSHLLPYLVPTPLASRTASALKLLTVNVHTANQRYDLVRAMTASHAPDIVLFTEVNEVWLDELKVLSKEYPYSVSRPRPDNFGIVMFSKIPPQKLEIVDFLAQDLPSVEMVFTLGSQTITLIGTHPLPPRTYEYSVCRNAQLELMGRHLGPIKGPKILMGDMNTVPWSSYFIKLLQEAGLKDTGQGHGISVTWPTHAWWLFGIPIDHILVSPELGVVSRTVGPWVGSDHYPVLVELAVP